MISRVFVASATGGDTADIIEQQKPSVSLDDLFRKTTSEPAIYWLPLTDEKVRNESCDLGLQPCACIPFYL